MSTLIQAITDIFPAIQVLGWFFLTMAYAVLLWLTIQWMIGRNKPGIPESGDEFPEDAPVGHYFFNTSTLLLYKYDGQDWIATRANT